MITSSNRKQMWHPDRGLLHVDVRSAAFTTGQAVTPVEMVYQWVQPALAADWWSEGAIDRFMEDPRCPIDVHGIIIVDAPVCACCGQPFYHRMDNLACVAANDDPRSAQYRCEKHQDRNPCAIEGCQRTTAAKGHYATNGWLCHDHWRRYVPPLSPARRAYHRLFRLAKKAGWTPELKRRFWRFWDGLVARARRQSTEGRMDLDEINKLFGWEDAA